MSVRCMGQFFLMPLQNFHEETHFQENFNQLKTYSSGFRLIDEAVQKIAGGVLDSQDMLEIFNDTIANYVKVLNPLPVVSCLQDLQKLERQLEEHSLEQLWDVLSNIINKTQIKTIDKKREWFEDEKNQSLLNAITALDFRDRRLVHLPREIYRLRNLRELDLSFNLIEFLPESIKVWTQLENLNLCHNELKYLPHNGIKHLKKLKCINVRGNKLACLPRSIKYLKDLEELNFEENYLEEIPQEIGPCISLKILNVSKN